MGKETVFVVVRGRLGAGESSQWQFVNGNCVQREDAGAFYVDKAYSGSNNSDVFEDIRYIVDGATEGISGGIFAYGQTGAGKTYTMRGRPEEPGVVTRTVARIFERVNEDTSRKFTVTGSYIEIYNNEINDLLAAQEQQQPLASGWASASSGRSGSHARPQKRQKIDIRYASGRGDITFTGGLTEVVLDSKEKAEELLADGDERRKTAATKMNDHSSRSHAVLLVRITSRPTTGSGCERTALLLLCDLCGSESAKTTSHDADRFAETKNINSDLSTLRRCFQKIISRERGIVPYRDCNLTGLLKPILDGGSGRLAIVCCIHEADLKNTKNTLEFATDAKKIEIDPKANEKALERQAAENARIAELEEGNTALLAERDELLQERQELQTSISDLQQQLSASQEQAVSAAAEHGAAIAELQGSVAALEAEAQRLRGALAEAEASLGASRGDAAGLRSRLEAVEAALEGEREALAGARAEAERREAEHRTAVEAAAAELAAANAQKAELEARLARVTEAAEAERRAAVEAAAAMEAKLAEAAAASASAAEKAAAEAARAQGALREQLEAAGKRADAASQSVRQLTDSLTAARQEATQLRKEVAELHQQIASGSSDHVRERAEAQAALQALEGRLKAATEECARLRRSAEAAAAEAEEQGKLASAADSAAKTAMSLADELQTKADAVDGDNARLRQEAEAARAEAGRLKAELDAAKGELAKTMKELKEAAPSVHELKSAQERANSAEAKQRRAASDLAALHDRHTEATRRAEAEAKRLEAQVAALQAENAQLRAAAEAAPSGEEAAAAEAERRLLAERSNGLSERLALLNQQLHDADLAKAKAEERARKSEKEALKLEQQKKSAMAEAEAFQRGEHEARACLQYAQSRVKQLEGELDATANTLRERDRYLLEVHATIESQKESIANADAMAMEFAKENDELRAANAALLRKVEALQQQQAAAAVAGGAKAAGVGATPATDRANEAAYEAEFLTSQDTDGGMTPGEEEEEDPQRRLFGEEPSAAKGARDADGFAVPPPPATAGKRSVAKRGRSVAPEAEKAAPEQTPSGARGRSRGVKRGKAEEQEPEAPPQPRGSVEADENAGASVQNAAEGRGRATRTTRAAAGAKAAAAEPAAATATKRPRRGVDKKEEVIVIDSDDENEQPSSQEVSPPKKMAAASAKKPATKRRVLGPKALDIGSPTGITASRARA